MPQVVIDFMIEKHTGNWIKTTDLVNKRYSHSDGTMRTFNQIELKVSLFSSTNSMLKFPRLEKLRKREEEAQEEDCKERY